MYLLEDNFYPIVLKILSAQESSNMGLNYTDPLIGGFFFSLINTYYSTT